MTSTGSRRATLAAFISASLILTGCTAFDYDLEQAARAIQPIPSAMVATMNARGMSEKSPIFVRVYKQESELEVWKQDKSGRYALLKTYPICRWSGRLGPKTRTGDRQAPEGFYTVTAEQMNPHSRYYLSFNLGYPNRLESALGYSGEALMIHGACSSAGCFAVTDQAAAEIYAIAREAFAGGQAAFQVQSLPFRMTAENFARHRGDPNLPFWSVLKEGADHFEITGRPPQVAACGSRYVFNTGVDPDTLDPIAPCPEFQADPDLVAAVAERRAADEARMLAAMAEAPETPAMSYVDGGMHESFRTVLAREGAERLAEMTSERAPVSKPEAALADPWPGR